MIKGFLYYHIPLGNVGLGRRPVVTQSYCPVMLYLIDSFTFVFPNKTLGSEGGDQVLINHLHTSQINPSLWYWADAHCLLAKELNFPKQHFTSPLNLHAFLLSARVFDGLIRWQPVTEEINTKEMCQELLQAENRCHHELHGRSYLTSLSLSSRLENGDNVVTCFKGWWGWNAKTQGGIESRAGTQSTLKKS